MLNILVVDDDSFEREGVKFLIAKYDLPLEAGEADSGEKAIARIEEGGVDILLTDIRMHGMDGLELAQRAKAYDPSMKVIMMSAYGEFEYAQRAIDLRAIRYILKPVEVNEFLKVMSQVIQLCEEERQAKDQYKKLEEAYWRGVHFEKQTIVARMLHGESPDAAGTPYLPAITHYGGRSVRLVLLDTGSRFFDLFDRKVEEELSELAPGTFELVHLHPLQSLLLMNASVGEEETLAFGERLVRWFKEVYDREMTIVVGGEVSDGSQFPHAFFELEAVLERKFFFREGTVLLARPPRRENEERRVSAEEALSGIALQLQKKQYEVAKVQFEQVMDLLQAGGTYSVVYVKHLCMEIAKAMYGAAIKKEIYSFEKSLEAIYRAETLEALKQYMLSLFDQGGELREQSADSKRKAIEDVIDIIANEYGSDLSLELLAERVYLSPSYLSYLFKKQTGISINKYITMFRMERARQLLTTTNQKIVSIGQSVGYPNFPYFSSLFKTHYGVSPSQYREEMGR
ncbi:response regulator [Paenibacillus sp.]|uniref:response regulator transcription factor n=1 Tax=Paenibacillus sp. TaxID=58172 RepID=UPI002811A603|nr:response regulator [Paenibacillus sp.]